MTPETNLPTDSHTQPELKQILGALVFASRKPITAAELHEIMTQADPNGEAASHPFSKIRENDIHAALEQLKIETAELLMIAKNMIELDEAKARQALRLIEVLEDHDDVQRVTSNFEIPEAILAEIGG